jgi:hypothetical protein
LHSIEERCARWILMTQDRMHAERRPTVTLAADMLKKAGLIEYSRGSVRFSGTRKRGVWLLQGDQGVQG